MGSVGTGVFSAVPGLLLLYYLTDVLAVPAAIAGAVLVAPKIWDVLLNPLVGAASDREAVRTGRRTRLLLAGAVALPVAFALMFAVPAGGTGFAVTWAGGAFLLAATAFACFQVPYVALPAEMAGEQRGRTRIMSWRVVCLTVGILVAGGLAPAVVDLAGGGRTGYAVMGVAVGAVMAAALVGATLGTRWVTSRPGPHQLGPVAAFRMARGNRPFFALLAAFVTQALGVAVMLAGAPYVAAHRLGDYSLTSLMFVCLVGPSLLAVPAWSRLARAYGHVRCYFAATLGFGLAALGLVPAIAVRSLAATLALTALAGVCYAALQLLPLSLLPDTVHADTARTGQAQAGAFTGLWTAGETAGLALGPGLFAAVLALSGFTSAATQATQATQAAQAVQAVQAVQTEQALTGMLLGFTALPAALMLLSLPLISWYGRLAVPREEAQKETA
ncbi:MFS transporter [Nonomuraea endophytica]|uniref:Na+/melibiose symporter-like transporter n=1 Tax=Nonomuraea endophytica TaxID=714136 RepID=A0A7W8EKH0_9ACTN|nr:MFS transporter [Nonomuraea endophytica]MBB5082764.1 Na+/melibiose symporter-like transporter [Nonomuraea endophytica]